MGRLIYERWMRRDQDDWIGTYVRSLPIKHEIAAMWSNDELNFLYETYQIPLDIELTTPFEAGWEAYRNSLRAAVHIHAVCPHCFTKTAYTWAYGIVT
jgi:hypothetical protein